MSAVMTTPGPSIGRARRTVPTTAVRRRPSSAMRSHRASAAVYRRRRLAAAALALGSVLAVGHAGSALGGPPSRPPERRPHVVSHVVRPGDTLWAIAGSLAPDSDRRSVVDALVDARGTDVVVPGETIEWLGG